MNNSKIQDLPLMKHFDTDKIGESVENFRKGEKGLFNILKLVALGAVLYFSWIYVLPPVFKAIGQTLAVVSTGVIVLAVILMMPVILKAIRRFTRFVHKSVIKHDPFGELEEQKGKMEANKRQFAKSQGKIKQLQNDMEVSAAQSEENAKNLETRITAAKSKAEKIKTAIDSGLKERGDAFKGTDEYIDLRAELQSVVSEADRLGHQYKQEKGFVQKYGSRANVMIKFSQKLRLVENSMNIKILDFDATISILKKDYEFAQKSREATDTAKSAMLFTEGWELEYALDVVTTTIAEDIAITAANFKDIDMLTSTYTMDSDELYAKLDVLADEINTGKDPVKSAKDYSNPEYKLTREDKVQSGGFGNSDIF